LVDFLAALGLARQIGLVVIRIEDAVAQIVVERAVKNIRPRLDGGVYSAAGFMAQRGVIGSGDSLELLDGVDASGSLQDIIECPSKPFLQNALQVKPGMT
jgi:hypothetical protein